MLSTFQLPFCAILKARPDFILIPLSFSFFFFTPGAHLIRQHCTKTLRSPSQYVLSSLLCCPEVLLRQIIGIVSFFVTQRFGSCVDRSFALIVYSNLLFFARLIVSRTQKNHHQPLIVHALVRERTLFVLLLIPHASRVFPCILS